MTIGTGIRISCHAKAVEKIKELLPEDSRLTEFSQKDSRYLWYDCMGELLAELVHTPESQLNNTSDGNPNYFQLSDDGRCFAFYTSPLRLWIKGVNTN